MIEKLKQWWTLDRQKEADTADSVLDPVRWKQRRGALGLIFVSFGWGFTITGMFIGSQIAKASDANEMVKAMIVGNLLLMLIGLAVGYPAYRTGCNNPLMFRMIFGNKGWVLPAAVIVLTGLGWQGSLVGMFPDVLVGTFGLSYVAVGLIGGILVVIAAYIGIKGLETVGNIAVIFLVVAGVGCIVYNMNTAGGYDAILTAANMPKTETLSTSLIIDMIVGSWAVGAMFAGDFTRFAKKGWVVVLFMLVNFCFAQPLLHILGLTGVIAQGDHVFTNYVRALSMLVYVFCMIAMIFAIWTTCNSNLYFTQVPFANITKKSMKVSAVILGGIGTIMAAAGFFSLFGTFVDVLASIVPPLLGPWAMDYYVIHRMKYDAKVMDKVPAYNMPAILSYAVGIILPRFYVPAGFPVALWNMIVAAVAYLVFYAIARAMNQRPGYSAVAELARGPYDPEEHARVEA